MKRWVKASVAMGAALALGLSAAQTPDAKTSREVFQDWSMTCLEKAQARSCLANHVIKNAGGRPVAVISLRQAGADQGARVEFALPLMLDLTQSMGLSIDGKALSAMPYSTCSAKACFVIRSGDDLLFDRLRVGREAVLTLNTHAGKTVRLRASLLGLGDAWRALGKQKP